MDSIILVGNGPSMIGSGLGNKIDEFAQVVRFNNFVTEGYEDDVGTKETILARRSCDDVVMHDPERFEQILNFITYCELSSIMKTVSDKVSSFYGDRFIVVNSTYCKRIGRDIGLDQPMAERCSIGVLAIGYLINKYDIIHICGFDHLHKDESGRTFHYFPKKTKGSRFHNGDKEKAYVTQLIKDGRIARL